MVSIKHNTLSGARPAAGIGATMWDEDHDVPLASQTDAEAGVAADKLMTPQRTAQAIAALTSAPAWSAVTGKPSTFTPSAHTHVIADVLTLQTALDSKQPIATVLTNTTASFTTAQETKLAGIAAGATVNSADAYLLSRANHTGTQPASSITGLANVATSGSAADLSTGTLLAARLPALTGDVTASAGSASTTIASGVVTLAKMADLAANSIVGNNTGSPATPLALSAAQVRTLLNVADGATANTGTVTSVGGTGTVSGLTLTGTVTSSGNLTLGGTLSATSSNISDFNSASRAQTEAALVAGANITITPGGSGATRTLTIASTGGGGGGSSSIQNLLLMGL